MRKLSYCLTKIFHWLFMIFVLFLFVSSIFVTATHEKYDDGGIQEFAKVTFNSIPMTFLQLVVGILCVRVFFVLFRKCNLSKLASDTRVVAVLISFFTVLISIAWIKSTNIIPGADQALCVKYAIAMNNGDFSALNRGGYLATYPHLLGFVGVLRLLFRLFGEGNYNAYRYLVALCIPVMVYSGYKVTSILSNRDRSVEIFYLLSMLLCFPVYGYVLFVYGDLAGPAIGMLSIWMFLECLDRVDVKRSLALTVSIVLSVVLRKSTVIFDIAMILVLILRLLKKTQKKDAITLAIIGCTAILSLKCTVWFSYPYVAPENSSLPSLACIAMSCNYDNGYAGWYNYYELTLHAQNGFYTDATAAAAKEVIKTVYIPYFVHNPKIAIDFFFNKINSQWQSPLYQSVVSNNLLYGGQNSFVMSVYYGYVGAFLEWFMKIYQMLMYLSIFILLWVKRKERLDISYYVTMIASFGIFILSIIWEAKGRYILPSFLILIPVYAMGAKELYQVILSCFKRLTCQHKKSFHVTKL